MAQISRSVTVGRFPISATKLFQTAVRKAYVSGLAGFTAGAMGSPRCRSRMLRTAMSAALVGLLVLGACGGDDGADESAMSADDGGSGAAGLSVAGSGAGGSGAAGKGAAGKGAAGKGAAGSSTAGSSATAAGSSAAGKGVAGKGAAGKGAAGSSTAGSSAGGQGAAGNAGVSDAGKPDAVRPPATSLSLPTTKETPGVAPWFNVYRPTDLAAAVTKTGQSLPVIAWANGGCFRSAFTWEPLFTRWAAGGFVVLALDAGSDGNPLATTTVDDQDALIDWTLAEANKQGSPYAGKLDTKRIVASGNSCGGVTALGVGAQDKRVTAVFVLSGSSALGSTDTNVMDAISVPVGYVNGGTEDISRAAATADYEALSDGIPAMIISRSSGDHQTVSTDVNILAQEAEMALNWMDLCLYGTKEAYDALNSKNICSGCEPGLWKLTSKNLEKLKK